MTGPWSEVADRVWIRRYASLDQTIGVIGGASGLVVIDTRATHRSADELLDELRQLPGDLVAAVNTHGHWDHAFGNARFSPAPIWGHVRCRAMVLERGEEMRSRMIEEFTDEADDFREVVLTPPSDLFEDEATLDLGDRQVELRHLGRGHTDNDIVITVPDAAVLFAGDLLENAPAPAFGDSYPIAWAETGRRILAMIEGTVVPGHGDPFDLAFAEGQVGELAELAAIGADVVNGDVALEDAIERSPFSADVSTQAFERIRLEMAAH